MSISVNIFIANELPTRMGIDPGHLITCSFMAAPCSLAVSKLFYPETEESKTTINDIVVEKGDESNVLDAAAKVTWY